MKESKSKVKIVVGVIFVLCVAAFAAGYGSHNELVDFGFRMITFALFLAVIWYAAGGMIKNGLKKRSQGIAKELTDLEAAKVKANKALKEVEARIIGLDKERQAILASYKAQGEAIKSEIILKAEKSARQIVAQSKRTAQNEVEKALGEMRSAMADEIMEATEKLLKERLGEKEHEKLIDKSLSKVVLN